MTKRYYAVIQLGHAIFGVGDSKKSAIEEAKYWVDEPETLEDDIAPSADAVDGDLIIAECSQSLHDAVNQQGGDVLFEERDGVYQLTSEMIQYASGLWRWAYAKEGEAIDCPRTGFRRIV